MDKSKREFLRASMLGAMAGTGPTIILAKTASAQNAVDASPLPLIVKTDQGWVGFLKDSDGLRALKAGNPESTPKINILVGTPVPDGKYKLGSAGSITVKNGVVSDSDIDPAAMGIKWKDFKEVQVDVGKKKIKLDEMFLPQDTNAELSGAIIVKPK